LESFLGQKDIFFFATEEQIFLKTKVTDFLFSTKVTDFLKDKRTDFLLCPLCPSVEMSVLLSKTEKTPPKNVRFVRFVRF